MNLLILFGTSSTSKLSEQNIVFAFTYKAIQWGSIDIYSSRFITYNPSFIVGKLFVE